MKTGRTAAYLLEANRQPARGEAAWDRERWKAGEWRHQAVASGCSLRQERRFMVVTLPRGHISGRKCPLLAPGSER
jgi:hypothetical protein